MKNNDNFFIYLLVSIALHLTVIFFFIFGFPLYFKKPYEEQIIAFEMLPAADISNIPTKKKQSEKVKEVKEEAKKILPTPAEAPKPKEEKKLELKEVKASEEKKPELMPVAENIKPKVEIKEKVKEEKKVEPKEVKVPLKKIEKPAVKKKKIPTTSDLDSLLKNLEQSSQGKSNKGVKSSEKNNENADKDLKGSFNENLPLSISEKSLIKQQIERNWNVPLGAENIDQARVILHILLEKNGTVSQVNIKDKICNNISENICQALAESALRAVWQASPLENLSIERYNVWKEIYLEVDPSQIAG